MATKSAISGSSLSFMERLSDTVYIYRPNVPPPKDSSEPKVIALFGWTGAKDSHLFRYIQKYREIFPTSAILLVKASVSALAFPSNARQQIRPAVAPLMELLGVHSDKPELLIHVFSNGGSALLSILYDVYAEDSLDERNPTLPLHVTIIDSAPARGWEYNRVIAALVPGIRPGWTLRLAMPIFHILAMWKTGRTWLLGLTDDLTKWAKSHNDKQKVKELRRAYCYGEEDPVVPTIDVQNHAAEAEANGFEVRTELFKGSSHVSHMKSNPERYWTIVEETWNGKAKL